MSLRGTKQSHTQLKKPDCHASLATTNLIKITSTDEEMEHSHYRPPGVRAPWAFECGDQVIFQYTDYQIESLILGLSNGTD